MFLPSPPAYPKSLHLDAWRIELTTDPDGEFLLNGIKHGFCLIDNSISVSSVEVDNYSSATNNHDKVEHQILEEIREGRYVISKKKPALVSAFGAIP